MTGDFKGALLFAVWTILCMIGGVCAGYRDGFRNGGEAEREKTRQRRG